MRTGALRNLGSIFSRVLMVAAVGGLVWLAPSAPAVAGSKKAAERHASAKRSSHAPAKATRAAQKKSGKSSTVSKSAATKQVASKKASGRVSTRLAAGKGGSKASRAVASHHTRLTMHARAEPAAPARLSFGQIAGLHDVTDPLDLKSSVALVVDQETREVLLSKNDHAVLPIASLTKLMTGLIISDARLPLDEMITITAEDVDTEKGSRSRLAVGSTLTRGELLHLALMSSENRAAHALGRSYPGGLARFVSLMNARALMLGMKDTRYVEPTGLSSSNRSSATDLATLVATASQDPLLRQLTTSPGYEVAIGSRVLQYNNTNRLVHNPDWQIGLQKTGYISEAGQCLVMQARVAGRKLIMVFLDSSGKLSRLADAERVRRWVEHQHPSSAMAGAALAG